MPDELDVQKGNIILTDVDKQPLYITVTDAESHQAEDGAAILNYRVVHEGPPDAFATRDEGESDRYVALLTKESPGNNTFIQVINSTSAALKLMRDNGVRSAVMPLGDILASILKVDQGFLINGAILGIREFAKQMRDEDSSHVISKIVVAAGKSLYETWMGDTLDLSALFTEKPEDRGEGKAIPLVRRIERISWESVSGKEPSEVQLAWLEKIGEFLGEPPPKKRHLTVKFGTETGMPISVSDSISIFDLDNLPSGVATRDVEYVEVEGRGMLLVGRNIVANVEGQVSNTILEDTLGIREFFLAPPSADQKAEEPEKEPSKPPAEGSEKPEGKQPKRPAQGVRKPREKPSRPPVQEAEKPEKKPSQPPAEGAEKPEKKAPPAKDAHDLVRQNVAFVNAIFKQRLEQPSPDKLVSTEGAMALANWLDMRTQNASREDINEMISARLKGVVQHDISISANGFFEGATTHFYDEIGEEDEIVSVLGDNESPAEIATNVRFRLYKNEHNETYRVPVSYQWFGDKEGAPFKAFSAWYGVPFFEQARSKMVLEDILSEIMFEGVGPRERLDALASYLIKSERAKQKVKAIYEKVNNRLGSQSKIYKFDRFLFNLLQIKGGKHEIDARREVRLAYLEMLMRMAIGDRKVDGILRIAPPQAAGGGTPQAPAGTPQAPESAPPAEAAGASPKFTMTPSQIRLKIVGEVMLPHSDIGLRDKFRAFVLYLTEKPGQWEKVQAIHDTIMVGARENFDEFFRRLKPLIVMNRSISKAAGIDITFLEIVMRKALGEATVDGILKRIASSTGGGEVGAMIRRWRSMIADKIVEITKGPIKPVTPAERYIHLVVTFNSITGEPISVDENVSLPKPGQLSDGRAAIKIDYVQKGYETSIRVEQDAVVVNGKLSDLARSVIWDLKDPLAPSGNMPNSASGNGGPGSAGAPPGGSGAPQGSPGTPQNGSSAKAEAATGDDWQAHMAPPPKGVITRVEVTNGDKPLHDLPRPQAINPIGPAAAINQQAAFAQSAAYLLGTAPIASTACL